MLEVTMISSGGVCCAATDDAAKAEPTAAKEHTTFRGFFETVFIALASLLLGGGKQARDKTEHASVVTTLLHSAPRLTDLSERARQVSWLTATTHRTFPRPNPQWRIAVNLLRLTVAGAAPASSCDSHRIPSSSHSRANRCTRRVCVAAARVVNIEPASALPLPRYILMT